MAASVAALRLVKLEKLMARSSGIRGVRVALLDGPVSTRHPDLAAAEIHAVPGYPGVACTRSDSNACAHGTFIAGILAARRGSRAPAICPHCTLLVRPIFRETTRNGALPMATADEVGRAIVESVDAGARVLNLSAASAVPSTRTEPTLAQALDYAGRRGVIVIAAAGNQATVGSSAITRHPWVIPVVACDRRGRPAGDSNLGSSMGRRGLGAPGEAIESLGPDGGTRVAGGTSAAAAFVTGAVALLLSLYPQASRTALKRAMIGVGPRRAVTPPLMHGDSALDTMERGFA